MRFTLDSNILVYGVDTETPEKHRIARDLILRAAHADAILTAQALAEFLAVIGRKFPGKLDAAREYAEHWARAFPIIPTTWEYVAAGAAFAGRHKLQLWDSIIWQAARMAGASLLLSEDMQDGLTLEGMSVLNPLQASNGERLAALLNEGSGLPQT